MFTRLLMALWISQWSYKQRGTFMVITQEIETCLDYPFQPEIGETECVTTIWKIGII